MKYSQFMHLVMNRVSTHKERLGAATYNVGAYHFPNKTLRIKGTDLDPTYTLKIRKFAAYIGITDIPENRVSVPLQGDKVIDLRDSTNNIIDLRDSVIKSDQVEVRFELLELD